jgi:membrane associated rhomboid family serine protease
MSADPTPAPRGLSKLATAPVAALLSLANVVVFALAERSGDTTTNETLLAWGATWRMLVWSGEWWRLGTSMFLHIGLVHLAWNTYAGWTWAVRVERQLGHARFLLLYLVSGVVASAASVLGHDVVAAGASGALFGLIGADLVQTLRAHARWREALFERRRDVGMIALWFALGLSGGWDNWAHAGGLLAGVLVATAFERPLGPRALAGYLALVLLVVASLAPLTSDQQRAFHEHVARLAASRADWPGVVSALGPSNERSATGKLLHLQAMMQLGDLDAGVAEATEILRDGYDRYALTMRGYALETIDDPDAGLRDYDELLRHVPDDVYVLSRRAWLTASCCPGAALRDAQAAIAAAPGDGTARLAHARALVGLGRLDEAKEELALARAALRGDPMVEQLDAFITQLRDPDGG